LAFLLPAVILGFAWALWKERIRPRAWLAIVLLQAILLGAGLVALKTGQNEEERVESVVPERAIQTHEARAEQFVWIVGATLAIAALVLVTRRPMAVRALTAATVVGSFLVAGAALRVGHAGGQLVYVHNAAAAYQTGNRDNTQALRDSTAAPVTESKSGDDDR
jgi:drug/metabolite transporter (DMT)-like permease